MTDPERPGIDSRLASRLDPRTRLALASVGAFGTLFAIGATIGWSLRAGISVAAGVLVAMVNLYGLAKILGAMLNGRADDAEGRGDGTSGLWGLFALVKVVLLFGGVWLLMSTHAVDPLPLVIGWGALPIGIAIGSLLSDKSDRSPASRAKEAPRK